MCFVFDKTSSDNWPRGPAVVVHVRHRPSGVCHLVVHDGVDEDGDAVLGEDLLWRDLVGWSPHVDLLVDVDAGDDEEHPGTSGSSWQETTKAEDDSSLVFLDGFVSWEHDDDDNDDEDETEDDDADEDEDRSCMPNGIMFHCVVFLGWVSSVKYLHIHNVFLGSLWRKVRVKALSVLLTQNIDLWTLKTSITFF